jgi:hypothetical protein
MAPIFRMGDVTFQSDKSLADWVVSEPYGLDCSIGHIQGRDNAVP